MRRSNDIADNYRRAAAYVDRIPPEARSQLIFPSNSQLNSSWLDRQGARPDRTGKAPSGRRRGDRLS
jgi:hypothetical protein